jgi:hypothetical protein
MIPLSNEESMHTPNTFKRHDAATRGAWRFVCSAQLDFSELEQEQVTMPNDQIIVAAFLSGYLQALSDIERGLRDEPYFHVVEREVALESIENNRNTKRIAALAAVYAATQAEVR